MSEPRSWQQIQRAIRTIERNPRNTDRSTLRPRWPETIDHRIGKANGAITARAGTTPGTGSAILYGVSTGSSLSSISSSSFSCINLGAAIAADSWVIAHRHPGSGKWLVEVPQGGDNSGSTPTSAASFPSITRTNNADQSISGATQASIKFQTAYQTYPSGSSAFTWSTTLHDLRFAATGVYQFSWLAQGASLGTCSGRWVVQLDSVPIDGCKTAYAAGPATLLTFTGSMQQAITSTTQAVRFRLEEDSAVTTQIFGSTVTTYARFDVRRVSDL